MALYDDLIGHPRFAERSIDYIRWYPKSLTPAVSFDFLRRAVPQGIYVHVPFCDRLCRFCPFNKRPSDELAIQAYKSALLREISLYGETVASSNIEFIYFGGGTPSVLDAQDFGRILDAISRHFCVQSNVEITAECHPTHLTPARTKGLHRSGITRISSGIQSFDDSALSSMGAQHTVSDAVAAIETVANEFGGIAIDLLFRSLGQTLDQWNDQIDRALSFAQIDHLSLYSLVLKDDRNQPDAVAEAAMTTSAYDRLCREGFIHYASCASGGYDFARSGKECVYEYRHWGAPQAEFIGLGPGAHGHVGGTTTVNGLELPRYLESLKVGRFPLVSATGTDIQEAMRRFFVLGVKAMSVPLGPFKDLFHQDPTHVFAREFRQLDDDGLAIVEDQLLKLTPVGRLFVDGISSVFFSAAERDVPHPEEPQIRRVEVGLKKRATSAALAF